MTAEHPIHLSSSCLTSILALSPAVQSRLAELVARLGSHLEEYPTRVWFDAKNAAHVYTHPDPQVEITYRIDETTGALECLHVGEVLVPRVKMFVSYSHKDLRWLKEFRTYISTLEEQGKIKIWDDSAIEAGVDWESALQDALRSAKAAVLLVSQDFLASDYIKKKELPVLEERVKAGSVRVDWIPLRHSLYEDFWFARIQALCDPNVPLAELRKSKREKRLKDISRQLNVKLSQLSD